MSLIVLPFHLLPVRFGQSRGRYGGTAVTLCFLQLFYIYNSVALLIGSPGLPKLFKNMLALESNLLP